jgi:type I restriction enzyme S subunit
MNTYSRSECVVFRKTKERFGGLSNMAGGFPLRVNGHAILTSEALYQALRFPQFPHTQRLILSEKSPMGAKMVGKPFRVAQTRSDWMEIRVPVMRYCLHVKLCQNLWAFRSLLSSTGDRHIVEESHKVDFWAAKASKDPGVLVGENQLGILLTALRDEIKGGPIGALSSVPPLDIPEFTLLGEPITTVT